MRDAVVIPAFNEEDKIADVLRKIPPSLRAATVVVDDGSTDATARCARDAGAIVIEHGRNRGVGAAIRSGIQDARARGRERIAVLSGDDQHDGRELPKLFDALDDCDLAQGSRWLSPGLAQGVPPVRAASIKLYSRLLALAGGPTLTDATNGMRAFRAAILDHPRVRLDQQWLDGYELEPYLLWAAHNAGYRVREVPVSVRYHRRGVTKMHPIRGRWSLARPLLWLGLGLRR